jgi:hypothetical protein
VAGDGKTTALLVGVWATFALDVFSTLNSSPQTTELFARDRENSLLHWVIIGDAAAIGGGIVGATFAKSLWPLLAAGGVALGMHFLYRHAVDRGQSQKPPAGSVNTGSGY